MNPLSSKVVPPGGGKDYDWYLDHVFVKVSGKETDGLYTIIEDKLEPGFRQELHLHRKRTETLYILAGEIECTLGDETFLAAGGTVIHIPPHTPHRIKADKPSRILIICNPAGYECLLETYTQLSSEQFEDTKLLRSLDEEYDFINLAR